MIRTGYDAAVSCYEATKAEREKVAVDIRQRGIRRREFERFITELEKLLRFAESAPVIENFDDELFQTFVDHIVVYGRDCIEFKLKCGLTLKEAI